MIKENYTKYIQEAIRQNWDLVAFTDYKEGSLRYAEVGQKILCLHRLFDAMGVKRGDKIALIGKNSGSWAVVFLAVSTYGAVIVPLLPEFRTKEIHHLLDHSESVLLFMNNSFADKIAPEEVSNLHGVLTLEDYAVFYDRKGQLQKAKDKAQKIMDKQDKKMRADTFILPATSNSDLLEILYTSGTSGFSKGVMLPHNSLASNMYFARTYLPLRPGDAILSFLPLAHAYGCAFELLFPFSMGAHITFLGRMPTPQIILQAFAAVKPRVIFSVPLVLEKIYKKRLKPLLDKKTVQVLSKIPFANRLVYSKIKKGLTESFGGRFYEIVVGGAALNKEVEELFVKIGFKYTIGYGMTECGPLISYADYKDMRYLSCGTAIDGMEIRIERDDPKSKTGEILVRGENLMLGYYKNEVATREAIDSEGWLHTGDLGEMDKDGYVYIRGRSKSMILGPSGQNIYPEEIEAVLNNLPLVQESLVVERDSKLYALLYLDPDTIKKNKLTKEDIAKELLQYKKTTNADLPNFMAIFSMQQVETEFEKTPKKSIKRFLYTSPNYEVHTIT